MTTTLSSGLTARVHVNSPHRTSRAFFMIIAPVEDRLESSTSGTCQSLGTVRSGFDLLQHCNAPRLYSYTCSDAAIGMAAASGPSKRIRRGAGCCRRIFCFTCRKALALQKATRAQLCNILRDFTPCSRHSALREGVSSTMSPRRGSCLLCPHMLPSSTDLEAEADAIFALAICRVRLLELVRQGLICTEQR